MKLNSSKVIMLGITIAFIAYEANAYTQSDLLNAQTNYQASKKNYDKSQDKLDDAKYDLVRAESDLQDAKKALVEAQQNLKNKQESVVIAKRNLDTAATTYNQAGIIVNNIWDQVNGKPKGSGQ